jgi:hypothetical protein
MNISPRCIAESRDVALIECITVRPNPAAMDFKLLMVSLRSDFRGLI